MTHHAAGNTHTPQDVKSRTRKLEPGSQTQEREEEGEGLNTAANQIVPVGLQELLQQCSEDLLKLRLQRGRVAAAHRDDVTRPRPHCLSHTQKTCCMMGESFINLTATYYIEHLPTFLPMGHDGGHNA